MNFDINLYEKVYNTGLGMSHLLLKKEDKKGVKYLFYVENNGEHYVICRELYGDKDGCSFGYTKYGSDLEETIKFFNENEEY